jgi:hypothetical protein
MAEPAQHSGDRLPWLTEVPRSAPPPQTAKRKKLPLLAFLLGALFALIAVGFFWLGSRPSISVDVVDQQPERPGMTAQVDTSAQAEAQAREAAAIPDEGSTELASSQVRSAVPAVAPRPKPAQVERRRAKPVRQAAALPRRVPVRRRAVNGQAAAPVALQPVVRGRIIQTGAYASRQEAESAWRALVRRWPYLGTKPRLISPLEVRSTDGRATQMFRVQLATASQAQSVVICQRLAAAKQSCVVVY